MHPRNLPRSHDRWSALGAILTFVWLLLGGAGFSQQVLLRGYISNTEDEETQQTAGYPGWALGAGGYYYSGILTLKGDNDNDPEDTNDPNEDGEGDTIVNTQHGPYPSPDYSVTGLGTPGIGDLAAADSQAQDPGRINTVGGPVSLAQGAETVTHPLLSLRGARPLEFAVSYNSQLSAGNQFLLPAAGVRYWTLYTPGDVGHWTHSYDGQGGEFGDPDGTVKMVVLLLQHRRHTFLKTATGYSTFDQDAAYETLTRATDGSYTLTTKDQSQYTFTGAGLYLTRVTNPFGQVLIIARDSHGRLLTVTEPISGKHLSFTYGTTGTAAGRIIQVTDSAGRSANLAYDANDMLAQVQEAHLPRTDAKEIKTTSFTYDSGRHLLKELDSKGYELTSNVYDKRGHVVGQTDARGREWRFNYLQGLYNGAIQAETVVIDPDGHVAFYIYDQNSNLIRYTSPLNESTTWTYDRNGNTLSRTDPLGHVTAYGYDAGGNVTSITDPLGKVTKMTYDARHNLLSLVDPDNSTSLFTYAPNNRLLTARDAAGSSAIYTYDANAQLLSITQPRGGLTTFAYTRGLATKLTNSDKGITHIAYDTVGRITSITDPARATTHYFYGVFGELLQVKNAERGITTYEYDYRLRRQSQTDPSGAVTQFAYDDNSNVTGVRDALGNTANLYYDGENRLTNLREPNGNSLSWRYDADGRLSETQNGQGDTITYSYDAAGNLATVTDGLRTVVVQNTYNARNELIATTDALQRTTNLVYDGTGFMTGWRDPLNRFTSFVRDALHRTVSTQNALNLTARQSFDSDGNPSTLVDPRNDTTSLSYDVSGRLTQVTTPLNLQTAFTYDSRNLPTSVRMPRGSLTKIIHDALGRVKSTSDAAGRITYTYDKNGRILTIHEQAGRVARTISRTYDLLGRLIKYTDQSGNTLQYAYDESGNLVALTYPDGKVVTYTYDRADRMSTVKDWAGRVTSYAYDDNGRLTSVRRPDGSTETFTYDAAGQLIKVEDLTNGDVEIYGATYGYDAASQLTSEAVSPVPISYQPTAIQMTVDADNRLAAVNGVATAFDMNSNLLRVQFPGDSQATGYAYDIRNRLTMSTGVSYAYNAEDRRISMTTSEGVTKYVVNPNAAPDQVLIRTAPGGRNTYYVYGLGLIGEESEFGFLTYHYDLRGNTVALTQPTGGVAARYAYGPFGEPIGFSPATAFTPFLYGGRWGVTTDPNGLYYMRARYYSPVLRRFLNQDVPLGEIGNPGTLNRFAYANGNPISLVDPFGLAAQNINWGDILQRAGGGLRALGGASEALAGGALFGAGLATSEFGVGLAGVAGGGFLAAHGADQFQAGVRQLFTGQPTDSLTSTGLQAAGVPQPAANVIDAGISIVGTGGAGLATNSLRAGTTIATTNEVILDTNAVIRFNEAQNVLRPGETPVITEQVVRELNDLVARGQLDALPRVTQQLPVVADTVDIGTQAAVRSQLGGFSGAPTGPITDLNRIQGLTGDGIIGTTGILTNRAIITADRALLNALSKLGAPVRGL